MSRQLLNEAYRYTGDYLRHFSYMFNRYSQDWNVNYFYDGNQRGGQQSYSWMRNAIQGLIAKAATLDAHRKHRERALSARNDATSEHHFTFFVPEKRAASRFQGMRDVI